jgi:hypothetical protein
MNKNFIKAPVDEQGRLETAATKTANFNGTAKNLGTGFAPGGIGQPFAAFVKPTAADRTSSDETYSFTLQESTDGGTTWQDCGPAVSIDVAGTVATLSTIAVPGFVSFPDVRLKLTVAGTTPSITYDAWLSPIGRV